MTLLKQAMAILGTVLTIAVLVAIISPKTAHAIAATLVQIEPGTITHVNQNEGQLVSLQCPVGMEYCSSIASNGATTNTPYSVPSGYTLIVTDWEYLSSGGYWSPGASFRDILYSPDGSGIFAWSSAQADANGFVYAHEKYTTGIRFASGLEVADELTSLNQGTAYLQGYLVPN